MNVEKCVLRPDNEKVYYTKYLIDNSPEIEADRKHPAMIVCPGGGYLFTSDREAEPVALYFLAQGYQAFVLRYTTADRGDATFPNSLFDLAEMIKLVRQNAEEWQVDPDKIAIIGFSAGGHLCASLSTFWDKEFLSQKLAVASSVLKPNAVIIGYPVVDYPYQEMMMMQDETANIVIPEHGGSKADFMKMANTAFVGADQSLERLQAVSPVYHVSGNTPPTFIWHTATDDLVYVGNSLNYAKKLEEYKVPFEMHIFEKGPHGMSLANIQTARNSNSPEADPDVAVWTELATKFLNRRFA